jgi:hypothetical protein
MREDVERKGLIDPLVRSYMAVVALTYGAAVIGALENGAGAANFWAWQHLSFLPNKPEALITLLAGCFFIFASWKGIKWFNKKQWLYSVGLGMLVVGVGLLTWYYRVDRSWGDRKIFLEMLTQGKFFRMSQPLTTALYALVYIGVQLFDWPPRNAIALVCSGAAMVTTSTLIAFLKRLPREEAITIGSVIFPCALWVLFFGYVETTVMALTWTVTFFFTSYRHIQGRTGLLVPALVLGIAMACHGSSIYLLPALLFLAFRAQLNFKSRLRRLLEASLGFALPVIIVVGVALTHPAAIRGSFVGDSLGGADSRALVPLFDPVPPFEHYTLFSIAHFVDVLNLVFLVSPFVLPCVWIGLRQIGSAGTDWTKFLGIGALSGLGFIVLWNPDLGMPQDWDLFAPPLLPVLLLGGHGFAGRLRDSTLLGMILLTLVNSWLFLESFNPVRTLSPSPSALPIPVIQTRTTLAWDDFELLGFDLPSVESWPGQSLNFTLYFRGTKPIGVGYTIFLHLLDANGTMLAQDDHQPFPPTEYWSPGEIMTGTFTLTVPEALPVPATLDIKVGAYFWQNLERLPLTQDGHATEHNISTLTQVQVKNR